MLGEGLHFGARSLEHRHLEATVVIEMNMERGLGEAVMRVEVLSEAAGKLARGMIVDVAQRRNALPLR